MGIYVTISFYISGNFNNHILTAQGTKCGSQNPHIEEQRTQWPSEKIQRTNNDLQNIHIKLKFEQHEPH